MGPQFPLWFALLVMPVIFWPVTLVVAIGLGVFGKWFRGVGRWICWGLGGVLLLFPAAALVLNAGDSVSAWWNAQRLKMISGKLQQAMTVDGMVLPAGTDVRWRYLNKSSFESATVFTPVALRGLMVTGTIEHDGQLEDAYDVQLAGSKQFGGWACGPGDARVGKDGTLTACTLERDTAWHTLVLPPGAFVDTLGSSDGALRFVMPDGRGMSVLGALEVPAAGVLEAGVNGSLHDVRATWKDKTETGKVLVERGIRFGAKMEFYPGSDDADRKAPATKALALAGELGQDVVCAGETVKAGTSVRIGPAGDELVVVGEGRGVRRVKGCVR